MSAEGNARMQPHIRGLFPAAFPHHSSLTLAPQGNLLSKQVRNKLLALINNIPNRVSTIPVEDAQGCPSNWRSSTTILVGWFADSRFVQHNGFAKYPKYLLSFYNAYVSYISSL